MPSTQRGWQASLTIIASYPGVSRETLNRIRAKRKPPRADCDVSQRSSRIVMAILRFIIP